MSRQPAYIIDEAFDPLLDGTIAPCRDESCTVLFAHPAHAKRRIAGRPARCCPTCFARLHGAITHICRTKKETP